QLIQQTLVLEHCLGVMPHQQFVQQFLPSASRAVSQGSASAYDSATFDCGVMRTAGGFSASGFALNTSALTDLNTTDAITINSPGLDGQVATVAASMFVQAQLGASASQGVISFGSLCNCKLITAQT